MNEDSYVRAMSLEMAAQDAERHLFGGHAGGVFAAFLLALDYVGGLIILVPGRPGYSMAEASLETETFGGAIFVRSSKAFVEKTMDRGAFAEPWRESTLLAFNSMTGGSPLLIRPVIAPGFSTSKRIPTDFPDLPKEVQVFFRQMSAPIVFSVSKAGGHQLLLDLRTPLLTSAHLTYLASEGMKRAGGEFLRRSSENLLKFQQEDLLLLEDAERLFRELTADIRKL